MGAKGTRRDRAGVARNAQGSPAGVDRLDMIVID